MMPRNAGGPSTVRIAFKRKSKTILYILFTIMYIIRLIYILIKILFLDLKIINDANGFGYVQLSDNHDARINLSINSQNKFK